MTFHNSKVLVYGVCLCSARHVMSENAVVWLPSSPWQLLMVGASQTCLGKPCLRGAHLRKADGEAQHVGT
jgi:hypothetical protein